MRKMVVFNRNLRISRGRTFSGDMLVSGEGTVGGSFKTKSSLHGEMIQFDSNFSDGLKPPTSKLFTLHFLVPKMRS